MIGIIVIIFVFILESPWWLTSKDKVQKAATVLKRCNGKVDEHNVDEQIVHQDLHLPIRQISNIFSRNS